MKGLYQHNFDLHMDVSKMWDLVSRSGRTGRARRGAESVTKMSSRHLKRTSHFLRGTSNGVTVHEHEEAPMTTTSLGNPPAGGRRARIAFSLSVLLALVAGGGTAHAGTYVIDNCPSAPS